MIQYADWSDPCFQSSFHLPCSMFDVLSPRLLCFYFSGFFWFHFAFWVCVCMYVCPRGEKGKGLVTCLQVLEKRKGGGGSCCSLYILLAVLSSLAFSTLEFFWSSVTFTSLLLLVSTYTDTLSLLPFLFVLVDYYFLDVLYTPFNGFLGDYRNKCKSSVHHL